MTKKINRESSGQLKNERSDNYGRPLGPGGGFGQGGYGGFGTQGGAEQPGGGSYRDGTWGNELHGGARADVDSKDASAVSGSKSGSGSKTSGEELAAGRMESEGGGSWPREEVTGTRTRTMGRTTDRTTAWLSQTGGQAQTQTGGTVGLGTWQRDAITAGQIMTTDIKTVLRESSLVEVASVMKAANCGVVPVVDGEQRLLGLVTDRDIVVRACAAGRAPADVTAGEVMTAEIEAVTPDEDLKDVIELMGQKQIRRIPIVDADDRLVGMISMGDIANRADHDEELAEALERVSARRRRRE